MRSRQLRLILAATVALSCAAPAIAQPTPAPAPAPAPAPGPAPAAVPAAPRGEPLTLASVSVGLARAALGYLRMVADVRYGALEVDASGRGIILRDLRVQGLGRNARCIVSLGRMRMTGLTMLPRTANTATIELADLRIANNCFREGAAYVGAVIGSDAIAVSQLTIASRDVPGTGAAALAIDATMPGFARIEAAADFDYFAIASPDLLRQMTEGPDMGDDNLGTFDPETGEYIPPPEAGDPDADPDMAQPEPEPEPKVGVRGTLRGAHVTVKDLGGWDKIAPLVVGGTDVPPEQIDAIVTAEAGTPLRAFQEKLAAGIKAFVANPDRLTVSVRPPAPVPFDTTDWQGPQDALALITPEVSNALPTTPIALLATPEAGGDERAQGLALARGAGVPANPRRAIELLTPLQDDGEVALALSELTAQSDPQAAYAHALRAAQAGAPNALAALDRAERALPVAAILAAQADADAPVPAEAFASVEALRDRAVAYEEGAGAARSYALAWRLASLAAATGDGVAQQVMVRLEQRFGGDPAWIAARDGAADLAAQDWTGQGLAEKLRGGP